MLERFFAGDPEGMGGGAEVISRAMLEHVLKIRRHRHQE